MLQIQRILFPTDFSRCAEHAFAHASYLAERFGITSKLPPYLPVALGAAEITLLEQTSAYSVFPNDGVRVSPRFITRVTDYEGRVLAEDFPAGLGCGE